MISIKKICFFPILLFCFLLSACTEDNRVETPDKEKPGISETILLKPEIYLTIGNAALSTIYDKHCWEDAETSCALTPTPAQELLKYEPANKLDANDKFSISFIRSVEYGNFPQPSSYEVDIHKDGEIIPVDMNYDTLNETLPTGRYNMSVRAIWEGEVNGEAIYAFLLSVK
ncbi:hypothetical protein [Sporosarcina sp. NCCP-2222]|uniref:hypothetical protein n=1 Tax=Sporosarcina sp. NCCP-2222 TaxID=2935073 RepID=UPI0020BE8CE7|nr:hypothetical protein [Sporosarcina sp. NCCP-2222]